MASGVEMLGQMSETEALAGPVQGGNMVVKPNEVPVGGAAMLAKAMRGQANKGVGGIYELPSQEPKTPEFMQMAKAGLQQGDPMRGMGPRKGLTPFDMANMEGSAMQAGIINFLGQQPEVTAPIRAQSHADAPPTELAYITAAEKQMLLDANMHGSLEGNQPNQGPAGIQSLDDFYNKPGGGVGGGSGEQVDSAGSSQGGSGSSGGGGGYQSIEDAVQGFESGMAVGGSDDGTVFTKDPTSGGQNQPKGFTADEELTAKLAKQEEEKQQDFLSKLAAKNKDNEKKSKEQVKLEAERNAIFNKGEDNMDAKDGKRLREIQKLLADMSTSSGNLFDGVLDDIKKLPKKAIEQLKKFGIIGKEIKDIESLPKKTQEEMMKLLNDFERLNVSPKEAMSPLMTTLKGMGAGLERKDKDGKVIGDTLEGLTKKLRALDTGDGASALESLKKNRPELYYKAFREPQTSGGLENFAGNTLAVKEVDESGKTVYKVDGRNISNEDAKRYNNAIFSAREQSRERNSNNQNNRPRFMEQTQEEVIDTPDGVVDEESQTMKYTSPRTGGTETSVPLQRRFRTDPTQDVARYRTTPRTEADILKYATQGTTGEGIGLEPFSEYQRRRRKALGLEDLGLFN